MIRFFARLRKRTRQVIDDCDLVGWAVITILLTGLVIYCSVAVLTSW